MIPQFEEGKTYLAEYEVTGRYMGARTMLGYATVPAKCTRRTPCYATFDIEAHGGIIHTRARIKCTAEEEYVVIERPGLKTIIMYAHPALTEVVA